MDQQGEEGRSLQSCLASFPAEGTCHVQVVRVGFPGLGTLYSVVLQPLSILRQFIMEHAARLLEMTPEESCHRKVMSQDPAAKWLTRLQPC